MSNLVLPDSAPIVALAAIPVLSYEEYTARLLAAMQEEGELLTAFADRGEQQGTACEIFAVIGRRRGGLLVLRTRVPDRFPSLTPQCPQLHLFEREMAEQYGLMPEGHPWLKPVRFHQVWNGETDVWGRDPQIHPIVGEMEYFQVEGDEIHEVGVGPVHAGIIEPGHFRFQCFGEKVLHLEISLGYQHRGIERMLAGGPHPQSMAMIETMAGDTSVGHGMAYCRLIETLAGCKISQRAAQLRLVALELERLANHVGDIGALAGDVGFLPTASYCGRLRGDYLNMTALICGSRFGRGLIRPGGALFDLEEERRQRLLASLEIVTPDTTGAVDLFFETPSVLSRLEGTGIVSRTDAAGLGLVGVAGRACGLPCGAGQLPQLPDAAAEENPARNGDVFSRAAMRRQEITAATAFIRQTLQALPSGETMIPPAALAPESLAVSLVEGWRGRIAHIGLTDQQGRLRRHKVVDPSFFNWSGLAMALRNEQISDFPLCNKSFNLSYCGFDL